MDRLKTIFLLLVGYLMCPTFSFAQLNVYQFEQIDSLQKIENKTVVIFIHTDWCKYCQAMKNTTFKNKKVVEQLNNNFYFVDFNAEEKRPIYFNNQTFSFMPTGYNIGIHQLAEALATVNKKITYPTLCFLNTGNEIVFQATGYKNEREMTILLQALMQEKTVSKF